MYLQQTLSNTKGFLSVKLKQINICGKIFIKTSLCLYYKLDY